MVQRKQLLLMSSDNSDDGVETLFGAGTYTQDELEVLDDNYVELTKDSFKNDTSINKQGSAESSSNAGTTTVVTGDTQDTDDSLSVFGPFDNPDEFKEVLASLDDEIELMGPNDDVGSVITLPPLPTPVPQVDIQTEYFNQKMPAVSTQGGGGSSMPALPPLPTLVPQVDI